MGRGLGHSEGDLSEPTVARRRGFDAAASTTRSVATAKLVEKLRAAAEASPLRREHLLDYAAKASAGALTPEDAEYAIRSLGTPSEPPRQIPLARIPYPPSDDAVEAEAIAIGFGLAPIHDLLVDDHERQAADLRRILDGDPEAEADYPELAWYPVSVEDLGRVKRAAFGRNVDPEGMDRDYSHQAILELDDGTVGIVTAKRPSDNERIEMFVESVVDHDIWRVEQETRAIVLQTLAQETLDRWVSESRHS